MAKNSIGNGRKSTDGSDAGSSGYNPYRGESRRESDVGSTHTSGRKGSRGEVCDEEDYLACYCMEWVDNAPTEKLVSKSGRCVTFILFGIISNNRSVILHIG